MPRRIEVSTRSVAAYGPIAGSEVVEQLRETATRLRGLRVLQLNATAYGGGVAELLTTLVPLMNDLGLQVEWWVLEADAPFFQVTKKLHHGLQGMPVTLTPQEQSLFLEVNRRSCAAIPLGDFDVVVVHDPQPCPMALLAGERRGKWIWRCHLDLSDPYPPAWAFLRPYVARYDATVFTLPAYVAADLATPVAAVIPPSIDPLSPKNLPLAPEQARRIAARFGIDPHRPLLTQVSRFDPWKDPLGVIDAYRAVKKDVPGLQLALVGSMAHDDPEGWLYYDRTLRHAGEDRDIFVLANHHGVGSLEVNAIQRVSHVIIQKSLREGFGLSVTEALWKAKPVVGGRTGGIQAQVEDGVNGFLVDSTAEAASRVARLLGDPGLREEMGRAGREKVRQHFLSTRHLLDYLELLLRLVEQPTLTGCRPAP